MRLHSHTAEFGPASPAIELANIDLLREKGEVSPLILDIATCFYSLRTLIARLRQPEIEQSARSQRNAGLSL